MASASAGQARSSMTARALSGQGRGSPLQLVPPGMVAPRSLLTTLQVSLSLHLQCCLQCTQVPRSPVVDDNTVMSDLHIKLLFHGATCHLTHTQCPAGTVKIALCQPFKTSQPIYHLFQDHPDCAHVVPYLLLGTKVCLMYECQFSSHSEYHTLFNPQTSSMQSFFAQKDRLIVCEVAARLFQYDKHSILIFWTRSLTTLAHL